MTCPRYYSGPIVNIWDISNQIVFALSTATTPRNN